MKVKKKKKKRGKKHTAVSPILENKQQPYLILIFQVPV